LDFSWQIFEKYTNIRFHEKSFVILRTRLKMSEDIHLFHLHAFMAYKGTTLPLPLPFFRC